MKLLYKKAAKKWIVLPKGSKQGIYLDENLVHNLNLYRKTVQDDRDLVFICAGKEREGKSTFANTILTYLDPTYNIDRCCFTGQQFLYSMMAQL